MSAPRPEDVDAGLIGLHGPEVPTPGYVALLVAPMARTWVDALRGTADRQAVAALELWVLRLERAARICHANEQAAACPPAESASGHFHHVVAGRPDDGPAELTAKEAADRLQVTPRTVGRLLTEGKLHGRKVGTTWLANAASVAAYQQQRRNAA